MSLTEWFVTARWSDENVNKRVAGRATEIIAQVAEDWGYTVKQLVSPRREKRIAYARFEAMYRLRNECPHMSLPMIGVRIGGRDHTTVLSGICRYRQLSASGELWLIRDGKKREGRTIRKEEERQASTLAHPVTEAGA
jgi:chromosomal replication initiation ATPase DnaA